MPPDCWGKFVRVVEWFCVERTLLSAKSRRQHTVSSQLGTSPNFTLQIGLSRVAGTIQSPLQAEFRGCFQWVLDAACQAVEWLSQPLGFESLTLCSHSTTDFILTSPSTRISLNMTGGVQHFCFQPRMTTGAFVFLWAHVGPLVVLRQRSPWVLRRAKNAGLRTTRYSRRRSGFPQCSGRNTPLMLQQRPGRWRSLLPPACDLPRRL